MNERNRIIRLLAVCLVLLLLPLGCEASPSRNLTVGTDIAMEDITDFYYTYDASTGPPYYQRYHVYVEEGQHLFYHETREGGGWPQTEEDITNSGTAEMTEEDWNRFCELIFGGKASVREEILDDGDAGPWLFLYYLGGEAEGRALKMNGRLSDLEAFFQDLAGEGGELTAFFFTRGGYILPKTYEVVRRDERYLLKTDHDTDWDEGGYREFDTACTEALQEMIAQYGLMSWDGFQESNPDVLDGESFILHLAFSDGKEVQAWGDNAFPDGYDEAAARVDAIFTQEEMAFLSGTYVYEGEGFGGDFTITLERDGTYCFYEGMLSSYLGAGQWTICDGAICMTEQSGMDASFLFRYEEAEEKDHLSIWYSARESDAFLYVSVPDGGRFVIHRGDAEEN